MSQESNTPMIKPFKIIEGAEYPLKVIERIAQDILQRMKPNSEWDNGYEDYNDRWIDRPAWSEHSEQSYSDRGGPSHSDHARTWKG